MTKISFLNKVSASCLWCLLLLVNCQNKDAENSKIANSEWEAEALLAEWQQNWYQFLNYSREEIDGRHFVRIKQGVLFNSTISKRVKLEKGKSYIIEAEVYFEEDGGSEFGLLVEQNGSTIGYNFVRGERQYSLLKIGTKIFSSNDHAEVILGFRNRGLSTSLVKSISIREVPAIPQTYSQSFANMLNEQLALSKFDSSNYHQNVLLLAGYVNLNLISPLKSYYALPQREKSEAVLFTVDSIRRITAKSIEMTHQSDFLVKYMNEPVLEVSNAYCVKTSKSSYEVLAAFNIPTRQLHFVNAEGVAIHQAIEYWHPYWSRWIIVDPFYGVAYKNQKEELLGFTEIKDLATHELLDSSYLVHENIEFFYFNLEELSVGWNENMFRGTMLTRDQLSFVY